MGFSRREKIFLVGALILSLVGWFFLCAPQWREVSRLKRDLAGLTRSTEESRQQIEAAERLKQDLQATQAKINDLERRILPRRDLTHVLEQLAERTKDYNIRIISMKPKPADEEKANPDLPYLSLPIEIEMRCRYLDLGRYLEALRAQPLLFNMESLLIQPEGKGSSRLVVQMVLTAYMWRGQEKR